MPDIISVYAILIMLIGALYIISGLFKIGSNLFERYAKTILDDICKNRYSIVFGSMLIILSILLLEALESPYNTDTIMLGIATLLLSASSVCGCKIEKS